MRKRRTKRRGLQAIKARNKLHVLDEDRCSKIHNAALRVLTEVGVEVETAQARNLLQDLGAKVSGSRVRLDAEMVEKALQTVPESFRLYDVNGGEAMNLDGMNMYFGVSTSSLGYLDPYSGKKVDHTRETSGYMARVADALPNVSYVGNGGLLADVDPRLGGRVNVANTLRHTTMPMYFCPDYYSSYVDIIRMAEDIAGGEKGLREKPFLMGFCDPVPPLTHSDDAIDKLFLCGDKGIPMLYLTYCMRGGTSPVSLAGAQVQCVAELLSGLVIHQAKNPGAPFIVGSMPTVMDMKTTIGSYGAPELHLGVLMTAELCEFYDLPFFGTAGPTDSGHIDLQAAIEVTMSTFSSLVSHADMIHDLGVMEHASALSPELLVLNDEIIGMLRPFAEESPLDEEHLAAEVISRIGPKGNYLLDEHTLAHFRSVWYPQFFDRSVEGGTSESVVREKLRAKTKEILENHRNESIRSEVLEIVEEHEKRWFREVR